MIKQQTEFDAIVVGSGVSGGWAAKELCEKGLKVLVLERGEDAHHGLDYKGEHAQASKLNYYGLPDRDLYDRDYFYQKKSYAFGEDTIQFWNNDRLNPYVRNEEKPFRWMRANVVGGRSLLWGRQTYRFSEQDFTANAEDNSGIPWPVSYGDIEPWYSYVEKFIGVSGQAEGLPQLPDGEFLPPMSFYALEKTIKQRLKEKLPDVPMTIGRTAILTESHNGRAACHYCGPCQRGCSTGSYFSSQSSTLPAAQATGNLTLLANKVVERFEHNEAGDRITSVKTVDSKTGKRVEYKAKLFFLCASTIASTQILLNSASHKHPTGLANGSGALGHYLMDHASLSHSGFFVDKLDRYYRGNRPNGVYFPRFRNLGDDVDDDADFVRGYGYQGNLFRGDWQMSFNQKGLGAKYKEMLRQPAPLWLWLMSTFIECLPYKSNRVALHTSKKDRFGIPLVDVEFSWGDNEKKLAADSAFHAEKILKAAGADNYQLGAPDKLSEGGSGIHEMGTARMGDDPTMSVLNGNNQAHQIPNLFVTDGSFMTSSSCVNPSLTYMAFTARACEFAVKQFKAGALS